MPRQQQQQQQWSRGGGIPHQHQRSSHAFPPARQARQQEPLQQLSRGIPTIGGDGDDGSSPISETLFGSDGGAVQEWFQSENVEMPMFSLLEGPQQSAPTAVALAAAAAAAEAMTRTRVFPDVSSKGVAEAPTSSAGGTGDSTCSSAGDRRYCFPHYMMKQRHRRRHRRPAVLFSRLHPVGGQLGRASRPLERRHRTL